MLSGDARHRYESPASGPARGAGTRRSSRAFRGAAHPRRGSGASRSAVSAVGECGTHPRRRALETFRRSAEAGARGADHETHTRFRPGLVTLTFVNSQRPKPNSQTILKNWEFGIWDL